MVTVWADFGFSENPYATEPIPASQDGEHLLVGRDAELSRLRARILAMGTHPTLEGDNGVGKTSLISVVSYRLRSDVEQGRISPVLLPLADDMFQLVEGESFGEFEKRVYFRIADTIVTEYDFLKGRGLRVPHVGDVKAWLSDPLVKGWGLSVSVLGQGGGVSRSTSVNTSKGYTESGLVRQVDQWLRQLFPTPQAGGFLCVVDNLELLATTLDARKLLEAARDPLFGRRGLRWILCGARGIVRTAAASPRLLDRLAEPIEVMPISDQYVETAIERRIELYRVNEDATAPVGPYSFRLLYETLNRNLRAAFKFAEDFSLWLHGEELTAGTTESFDNLLEVWLADQADRYKSDTVLGNRAWEVFDLLADRGGWCSPSDHAFFGFKTQNVMRTHVRALEDANLVTISLNDENDKRRKAIMMTARGWLVRYARCGYQAPATRLVV